MKFIYIGVIVILLWKVYILAFKSGEAVRDTANKQLAKIVVDRRNEEKERKNISGFVKFMKKYSILKSDNEIEELHQIILPFKNITVTELLKLLNDINRKNLIKAGISLVVALVFNILYSGSFLAGFAVIIAAFFVTLAALFLYKMLKNPISILEDEVKTSLKDIEDNFDDIFEHIYHYYSNGTQLPLSEVMVRYRKFCKEQMRPLVNVIIKDCSVSDTYALKKLRERYKKSNKITEFTVKIEKCISGHRFGRQSLESLKEQLDQEKERNFEEAKINKFEGFIRVFFGTVITVSLLFVTMVLFSIIERM